MLKQLVTAAAVAACASSGFAEMLVIRNVNVIPMTGEKVLGGQNVIVENGRIASVGTMLAKLPAGTKVIDGTGKYLTPGLAEMHGHIPPPNAPPNVVEDVLFEYVANGITTVRGMLGHPGQLELREKAKRGEIVAPNLYLAGPSFNDRSVNSPEEAVKKVRDQKREGWDLLKVHPGLTRDEYDAMARTARADKIRFGGHVPVDVGLLHAIEMGQETFDHMDGYVEYLEGDKGPVDPKKLTDVVKRSRAAGVWIVPTMALWEVLYDTIDLKTLRSYDELKYVSQTAVDQWTRMYNERFDQMPREAAQNVVDNRIRVLRALSEGGVKILMGTDAPQQFSVPGFSLHRELQWMRRAGMTPYQIMVSGTRNVGEYFRSQDNFGTIEKGKRADLILLEANPLDDIANVSKIAGVMVNGRWFPRQEIDARLATIAARYAR
ncbi:MAG TPA: amidohydrolase family protein [Thermoanaerobaculia bacterium]|nr:amidohydrolase family protein [Thermoanaerobaculia bacterium]